MNKEIMTPDRGLVIQRKRRCKVCKAAFSTVEYISFRDREKINGQGGGQK
jgi:transcriptional regulator NrdR family protein